MSIATFDQIIENPEAFLNRDVLVELALIAKNAAFQHRGPNSFRFVDDTKEAMRLKYLTPAMLELTERNAFTKGECAALIAEKAVRLEALRKELETTKTELRNARSRIIELDGID